MERKQTQAPRMDRKTIVLTVVAALLVIAIIVIAIVLMQRSGGDTYREHYETAMESYNAGDYTAALASARLAYAEDATEEAVLLIARSCAGLEDYKEAVSALEAWVDKNGAGSEAGALLEKYRAEMQADETPEPETVSIAGQEYPLDTETLVISDTAVSAEDMSAIAKLTGLSSLSLNGCSISDISPLSQLTALVTLSLENNSISDLSPLASLRSLETLFLSGNSLGSLEPLYRLDRLTTLDIRGREITRDELDALQAELPGCMILSDDPEAEVTEISLGGLTFTSDVTELDLSNRGITDISALSSCTMLESLNISGNIISNISVLGAMPNLKTLDISNNEISNLSPLIALANLESVNASGNAVANISALSGHTALVSLNLDGNPLENIEALESMTGLRSLSLRSASLQDEDLALLQRLTWLESLNLEDNAGITAAGADALIAALPNCAVSVSQDIYTVTLGSASFEANAEYVDASAKGVASLAGVEHFTALQVLILNDNTGIDISNAGSLTTVQALELAGCGLTDVSALSGLTQLTTLNLMLNDLGSVAPLSGMTALSELHLSMNARLSDISALAGLKNLTVLSLNGTAVTDLSALSGLTRLETLDLEGCSITSITPLLGLTNLKTLYAAGCGLTPEQIDELGAALPDCTIYT